MRSKFTSCWLCGLVIPERLAKKGRVNNVVATLCPRCADKANSSPEMAKFAAFCILKHGAARRREPA